MEDRRRQEGIEGASWLHCARWTENPHHACLHEQRLRGWWWGSSPFSPFGSVTQPGFRRQENQSTEGNKKLNWVSFKILGSWRFKWRLSDFPVVWLCLYHSAAGFETGTMRPMPIPHNHIYFNYYKHCKSQGHRNPSILPLSSIFHLRLATSSFGTSRGA